MNGDGTRLLTPQGVLAVTPHEVRLERARPLRLRPVTTIPRDSILIARLGSRFHSRPLFIGGLLLIGSLAATALAVTAAFPTLATGHLLRSLALVLLVGGMLFVLALPLSWRAVLEVSSGKDTIRVETGFRRRERLAQALALLHSDPGTKHGQAGREAVRTPSARPARSP